MANEINWNDIYKSHLSATNDPFKAAEYTVYGRLTNSKKIPQSYTKNEWYQYEAPDYWSAINYKGNDRLATYTGTSLKGAKSFNDLINIAKGATDKGLLSGTYGQVDYYNDLKTLWTQKGSAEKKSTSSSANWWKQYGLPDPSMRYDGTTNKYDAAETYIANQTAAYAKKLGKDPNAVARTKDFNNAIRASVYKKINDSGVTPFLTAAQQYVKARG